MIIENATKTEVNRKLHELETDETFVVTEISTTDDKNILTYVVKSLYKNDEKGLLYRDELQRVTFEWSADDDTIDKCKKPMCSSVYRFGVGMIKNCLENVEMKDLYDAMHIFSNFSFGQGHRDKYLNILDWILDDDAKNWLYPSATYGTCPATECTYAIGHLTGRKRDNLEIFTFLLYEKKEELKNWLLENHSFSDDEKRLLNYFQDGDEE